MPAMARWKAARSATSRLLQRTEAADLGLISAGIAFFAFLALFPAVAAIIAIWGFASDPGVIRQQIEITRDFLPTDAYALLSGQVEVLLAANSRTLGRTTVLSTLLALWSARAGVAALIRGLNAIHHLPNRSGHFHALRALALTLLLVGVMLMAMLLALVVPVAINFLPINRLTGLILEYLNLGVGLLIVVAGISLAYRLGPNRPNRVQQPVFTPGLTVAVILWALASRGFVIYLANFNSYNEVYGSIGAVVALLMWLYLSAYAVLLGAAVDADREAVNNPSR